MHCQMIFLLLLMSIVLKMVIQHKYKYQIYYFLMQYLRTGIDNLPFLATNTLENASGKLEPIANNANPITLLILINTHQFYYLNLQLQMLKMLTHKYHQMIQLTDNYSFLIHQYLTLILMDDYYHLYLEYHYHLHL